MKKITINYMIVKGCNFKCNYCINIPYRDINSFTSKDNLIKFYKFIKNIFYFNPNLKMNIGLLGGEPLLEKNIFYLVDKLFSIYTVNLLEINIVTNGFFIYKYKEQLKKYSNYKNFNIEISYHFYEYKKYDKGNKIFINNIKILKENNISFKVKFLIPNIINDFTELNIFLDNLIVNNILYKKNILLELIKKGGKPIEYDKKILNYFNVFYQHKFLNISKKNKQSLLLNKDYSLGLTNYKGFKCYPFKFNTFLSVDIDLKVQFVGCKTLIKKYNFKEIIKIFSEKSKYLNKYVICTDNICDCITAGTIYKEKFRRINYNNLLLNKLSGYFILENLKLYKIEYLNNNLDINKILLYFTYNTYFLVFSIDKKEKIEYMWKNNFLGIHYYFIDKYGKELRGINGFENVITFILTIIIKLLVIFNNIIYKGEILNKK